MGLFTECYITIGYNPLGACSKTPRRQNNKKVVSKRTVGYTTVASNILFEVQHLIGPNNQCTML